jgi:hypothetical protein
MQLIDPFSRHSYQATLARAAIRRSPTATDTTRVALLVLTGFVLLVATAIAVTRFQAFESRGLVGVDRDLAVELGRRWFANGTMYLPYQFAPYAYDTGAGSTDLSRMPGLYPPISGPVFWVAGYLPAIAWWGIPLSVISYSVLRFRPAMWSWPIIAALLVVPNVSSSIVVGNTTMWVSAAVASGLVLRWPVLIVLLKPTFAPLLILGIRSRAVWAGLLVAAGASLLMLAEWGRYVQAVGNSNASVTYSLPDLPLVLLPAVAFVAGRPGTPFRHGIGRLLAGSMPRRQRHDRPLVAVMAEAADGRTGAAGAPVVAGVRTHGSTVSSQRPTPAHRDRHGAPIPVSKVG